MTNPEQHRRLVELFHAVRERPIADRAAFLDQACGGDPTLLREVEALLARDAETSNALDRPVLEPGVAGSLLVAGSENDQAGEFVGPYKLISVIGEGGFGIVWLAERREPMVQRVALKIIKAGMDSVAVIARFEQERQALALMDHPNVARIFDGGVTPASMGARPYFVMEHVQGEPITDYCDRHTLTIAQRLELFIPVCEAVQHAHVKGIIHRDLKPSNILVTVKDGVAIPKVIDFGVAKAISQTLTDRTIFTESGLLIGTPEYMSPEQAEMGRLDVDTRTDVYSLGVVLYELLSGLLPFDTKSLRAAGVLAICKIIREQEPQRPSTRLSTAGDDASTEFATSRHTKREQLARVLRRELDWIPLKAIRKDRAERYGSPADLGRDIRHYLDGRPLEAGPERAAYQLRKFIRRNKGSVVAVGAVMLALVAGLVGTMSQARIAVQARQEADEQRVAAVEGNRRAEYESYRTNIAAANASLSMSDTHSARQRLNAASPPFRGWEWRYLSAMEDTCLRSASTKSAVMRLVPLGGGGGDVYAGAIDGSVWHLDDSGMSHTLESLEPRMQVQSVAASPDSRFIAAAFWDGSVCMWDADTGKIRAMLRGTGSPALCVAFSPNSRLVAASYWSGTISMWDVNTASRVAKVAGHPVPVHCIAFSPSGELLASGSVHRDKDNGLDITDPNPVRLWHVSDLAPAKMPTGIDGMIQLLTFAPDSDRLTAVSNGGDIVEWSAASGMVTHRAHDDHSVANCAAIGPTFKVLAVGGVDGTIRLWSLDSFVRTAVFTGHTSSVLRVAFSPDGGQLASASTDQTVRLWSLGTSAEVATLFGHTEPVVDVSFASGGTRLVSGSADGSVRWWSPRPPATRLRLQGHRGAVNALAFSPDDQRLASAGWDATVRLWDANDGLALATMREHTEVVMSVSFDRQGDRLSSGSWDTSVRTWNARSGEPIAVLKGHSKLVGPAAFSADGRELVSASADGTVRVWDLTSGREPRTLADGLDVVPVASISHDGKWLLVGDWSQHLWVWRTADWTLAAGPVDAGARVNKAAFSEDDALIATAFAGDGDHRVAVWRRDILAEQTSLRGHSGEVSGVAFVPHEQRIVTCSVDRTIRLWAFDGTEVATLTPWNEQADSIAVSHDGTRIACGYEDGTIILCDSESAAARFMKTRATHAEPPSVGEPAASRHE